MSKLLDIITIEDTHNLPEKDIVIRVLDIVDKEAQRNGWGCTQISLESKNTQVPSFSGFNPVVQYKYKVFGDGETNEDKPEVKPSEGKAPISLIPREAILETAKCFDYGSKKHGRYAFREGVEYTKLIDAGLRHLYAVADGEDEDNESKCLHAAAVMANMAMLIYMMKNRPEMDDRK